NFQCPVTAKSHISFARCSVDINTQTTGTRFPFQKRYMRMRFSVFKSHTQIKDMWIEHKSFVGNFKAVDGVVLFGVENMFFISSERTAEMHIVAVAAETKSVERLDLDGSFFHLFEDALVRKDHEIII